jgi:DNA-binding response OmpR family regulator
MRPRDVSMTLPQLARQQCTFDGETVQLGRRETAILAVLLVRRGVWTPAEVLIQTLWPNPDHEPEHANQMIPRYLCDLRCKLHGLRLTTWHGQGWRIER